MKSTVLFLRLGIFLVTTGIILGAFGAHALKEVFTSYELDIWEKGIFYQISNGLGLILIVLLTKSNLIKKNKWSLVSLSLGIILFSGSLYTIALVNVLFNPDNWVKILMIPITPLGGTLIILGWLITFFKINKT
jgi:uncharacterized membrane protein YgdD (TMEM256/DUF423 family)